MMELEGKLLLTQKKKKNYCKLKNIGDAFNLAIWRFGN